MGGWCVPLAWKNPLSISGLYRAGVVLFLRGQCVRGNFDGLAMREGEEKARWK